MLEPISPIESKEPDTTEYLLSAEANRQHLMQALKDAEDPAVFVNRKVGHLMDEN